MISSFDIEREIINAERNNNTGEVERLEALLDIKIREEKHELIKFEHELENKMLENKKFENETQRQILNTRRGFKL